jgi:hypothetical protein
MKNVSLLCLPLQWVGENCNHGLLGNLFDPDHLVEKQQDDGSIEPIPRLELYYVKKKASDTVPGW